ncbi:unnamed protein product [Bursaphelenchus okinawaensis]|uniref:CHK kinase-like domain-containing protein n=1 Tax=Bursaphelenchus okinawaensis TaxID=465554 RepID=A0A811LJK9_9BILA|nr:unnamed protein product [Bursaphelenchus okinawaensis]CAG9124848.1 unnamed protein product [Bursaphelenchus okinawaensis]
MTTIEHFDFQSKDTVCSDEHRHLMSLLTRKSERFQEISKFHSVQNVSKTQLDDEDSFMSVVYKITVTFSNDMSVEYCLKVPTCDKMSHLGKNEFYPILCLIHNKECDFYEKFQKIDNLNLPKTYAIKRLTPEDHNGFILMEFVKGRCVPVEESLNLQQLLNAADQMALVLNYSINDKENTEDPEYQQYNIAGSDAESFKSMKKPIMEYVGSTEETKNLKNLIKKLGRILEDPDYIDFIVAKAHLQYEVPSLLCHGDLWSNNLFFDGDAVKAIIDWQSFSAGNPTQDLVRLLILNCSPEIRRNHDETVYRRCYDTLTKLQGKPLSFTFENFLRSARVHYLYQIYLGLYILTHKYSKTSKELQRKVFIDRMEQGIIDSLALIESDEQLRAFM